MSGLNSALNIGKSSLAAQLYGMQVTGNNISNVNTKGYTRQRVNLAPTASTNIGGNILLGSGVTVTDVQRIRDSLLDIHIRSENGSEGRWEAITGVLDELETVFNETSDGTLGDLISEFWNNWQDLSNDPESTVQKSLVSQSGTALCNRLNYVAQTMSTMRSEINADLSTTVDQVNSITLRILDLNSKIQQCEAGDGQKANDYRDARDLLVDELSGLINITTTEMDGGAVSIYVSGSLLVSSDTRRELTVTPNAEGMNDVCWKDNGSLVKLTDGKIKGALDARDAIIPKYTERLNELAKSIIENVNRLHSQGMGSTLFSNCTSTSSASDATASLNSAGLPFAVKTGSFTISVYDADGNFVEERAITVDPATDSLNDIRDAINAAFMGTGNISASIDSSNKLTIEASGTNRFGFVGSSGESDSSDILMALGINTFFSGYDASSIDLNSAIESDPTKISCGKSTAPGDNTIALAIGNLRDTRLLASGTMTVNDYYESTIGSLGIDSQEAQRMRDNANLLGTTYENQREAYSGVSLDEEMTEMLKFQHAYNAAAKYIATINEIMQVLFSTM